MPALRTETSHLLLYDPDKSRTTVHCYLSRPTPLEERTLGRLLLLVEIDSSEPNNQDIIQTLQADLSTHYYQSADFHMETAFEQSLQRLNDRLHQLVPEHLEEWLDRFHIIIAVLKETTLHFTVVGRMHAFLIHRQRIIDILESSSGAATEPVNPLKIFSNIISGQLNLGDSLLFCTTSLLDYLSQEKLKRIVSEQSPTESTRTLDGLLAETDGSAGFGAVILRLEAAPEHGTVETPVLIPQDAAPVDTAQPQTSMEQLIRREQQTNELLTHSLWPNLGRLMKTGGRYVGGLMNDRLRKPGDSEPTPEKPTAEYRPPQQPPQRSSGMAGTIGRGFLRSVRLVAVGIVIGIQRIVRLFRKPTFQQGVRNLPSGPNRRLAQGARWFLVLTPARRRLLLVAVVLIILFAQSVVVIGQRQETKKTNESYRELLVTAQEKVDAAQAALMIQNESAARRALTEASDALGQIPAEKKDLKDEVAALRSTIQSKLRDIQHVISVEPELIYDLAGLEVGFSTSAIAVANKHVYTFNTQSASIYGIAIEDKKSESIVDAPSLEHPLMAFVPDKTNPLYLLQNDGGIQELNVTDKKLASVPIAYANVQRDIRDAFFFNNRLYTLDAKNNQIFRHQRADKGFGTGTAWITDTGVDLQDARSLAIDGAVYVLKENGTMMKFSSGKKDATAFDPVDPAFGNPTVLYTTANLGTLLVVDQKERRVVEYAKDGKFLRQYASDKLGDLRDVAVVDGMVYVLSGTQVFRFPLTTS